MDTRCEAKPSSSLNQGGGSNLSNYISSAEQGEDLNRSSLSLPFLCLSPRTFFVAGADGDALPFIFSFHNRPRICRSLNANVRTVNEGRSAFV